MEAAGSHKPTKSSARGVAPVVTSSIFNGQQSVHVDGGYFHTGDNIHYCRCKSCEIDILSALKDIPNYRDIHSANFARATKGTGPQFDEWHEYQEWLTLGGLIKAMWGIGMPGAGKTVFSAIVINKVEALAQASKSPISVGYIYFRYSDHTSATTQDCLEVLVKQTIERHPDCLSVCSEVYKRHIRERTRPSEAELLGFLEGFAGMMLVTCYFLDAMDEAPPDVQLDLLEKLSSLNVRLFITSRPMEVLQARFPRAHHYPIRAQDRDLDLHISKEISRSVVLQDIIKTAGQALRDKLTRTVKEKCGGMFLHASLQLDALRGCTNLHGVEKTLSNFPPRIEDVYNQTWQRICDQSPDNALIGKNILRWVLCANRSLKIDELRRCVAMCPETHKFDESRMTEERTLMGLCRGLVTVEDLTKVVRFVHYTAQDVVQNLLSESFPYPHSVPTQVCLTLLASFGFQHLKTVDSNHNLSSAVGRDPLLRYAWEEWSFHASQSLGEANAAQQLSEFIPTCTTFPVFWQPVTSHYYSPTWDWHGPLHMAAYFDLPISFAGSACLQKPNLRSRKYMTPLMLAAVRNSSRAAAGLLALPNIRVDSVGVCKETALILASLEGNEDIVKLLLAHSKVDVNQADKHGETPLMKALKFERNRIVRQLLSHSKININQASNILRRTALFIAIDRNSREAIDHLLSHRQINVNWVDKGGLSVLMLASKRGQAGIVKRLLAHPRIDVNLVDLDEMSAMDFAREGGHRSVVQLLLGHPRIQEVSMQARMSQVVSKLYRHVRGIREALGHSESN